MKRDQRVKKRLSKLSWRTMVLKGSEILKDPKRCAERIKKRLSKRTFKKTSAKAWKWFCLRYHKDKSCSEIARKFKVSRQAVNGSTIRLAYKLLEMRIGKSKCCFCQRPLLLKEAKIKTNLYDNWKKYNEDELAYIGKNIRSKSMEEIARHLRRTPKGIEAKLRRMKYSLKSK